MRLAELRFRGYTGGGCVPYLIANLTNSDHPIKDLEITKDTSFDEYDASRMFQKAMDSKAYFKAIIAEDRYLHKKEVKALKWISSSQFAKSATIQQVKAGADGSSLMVVLLEVFTKNRLLHAVGMFYNPANGLCIIIDPAKDRPIKRDIGDVFSMYKVLKVCPLFFNATGVVMYPVKETGFLFEVEIETEKVNG